MSYRQERLHVFLWSRVDANLPRARNVLGVVNRVNKFTHGRIYTYVLDMRLFAANIISFFNRGVAYLISQRNFVI